jgi:hypothetical protein
MAKKDQDAPDNTPEVVEAPAAPEEPKKTILLKHPITHDSVEYSRGEHTLPESIADLFLKFKDPVSHGPIAVEPKPVEIVKGTVKVIPTK